MIVTIVPPGDRESVLRTLVEQLVEGTALDPQETLAAVVEREAILSSRVTPRIAMPHAIVAVPGETLVAVGICREGISWDSREKLVQVVVLLVGPEEHHLDTMATLARKLQSESTVDALVAARTSHEGLRIMASGDRRGKGWSERARSVTAATIAHAAELARVLPDNPIVVACSGPAIRDLLGALGKDPLASRTLLVGPLEDDHQEGHGSRGGPRVLSMEQVSSHGRERPLLTLLPLVASGMLNPGAEVILVSGRDELSGLDAVRLVDVSRDLQVPEGLAEVHFPAGVRLDVVMRALHLAAELGSQGREGKSVGTIMVIGDDPALDGATQQMILNPFAGYPPPDRNILDPSLTETIKELAKIDGAFLISGDGTIRSAGTHLSGRPNPREMEAGLGARHAAALGITAVADVLALCLSESTGALTLFHGGRRITRRGAPKNT